MVIVGGLALLGEVAIGLNIVLAACLRCSKQQESAYLDAVLEAVELSRDIKSVNNRP